MIYPMLPPVDIHHISHELARLGEHLQRAYDERPGALDFGPRFLLDGLGDLLDTLSDTAANTPAESARALHAATGGTPDALLAHGLDLLAQLADQAEHLNLPRTAGGLEQLSLALTCWMLRLGAELDRPEFVVNATAGLANTLHATEDLAGLYALMTELVEGMSPARIQEPGNLPSRPWRILLLNRAIVATRSQRPALMVAAFDSLVEHLPEDAPDFFREGMGQMETLRYPAPVRELMQRYYDRWCTGQRLH